MPELKRHISFHVPLSLHKLVDEVAAAEGRYISDVVRELLDPEQLRRRLAAAKERRDELPDRRAN